MVIGNRYFIDNIETGLYEVSKEEYERYTAFMKQVWEQVKIKLAPEINFAGRPIVFGTSGEMDDNQDLKNLFYDSKNYKLT